MRMNKLKEQLNDELSFVNWSQQNHQAVMREVQKGETVVFKKKFSMGIVLAAALMLVVIGAIAATMLFTPRYDAGRLADEAMQDKYGVTAKMMTVFKRDIIENDDGTATVKYVPVEPAVREGRNPVGEYVVEVANGKADARWSLDGKDTSGGLAAEAWGPEQLLLYVEDFSNTSRYMKDHGLLAEEYPIEAVPYEEGLIAEAKRRAEVLAAAEMTVDEAKTIARSALVETYGMTEAQEQQLYQLTGEYDQTTYEMINGRPVITLLYHLNQGAEWQEMDGIYVVKVNLQTGAVEEIFYDSGLAGNG